MSADLVPMNLRARVIYFRDDGGRAKLFWLYSDEKKEKDREKGDAILHPSTFNDRTNGCPEKDEQLSKEE